MSVSAPPSLSPQAPDVQRRTVRDFFLARPARPYIHPYLGAILLGLVLFLAFFITGNGLGASGGLARARGPQRLFAQDGGRRQEPAG